jgi:hypothetical protein
LVSNLFVLVALVALVASNILFCASCGAAAQSRIVNLACHLIGGANGAKDNSEEAYKVDYRNRSVNGEMKGVTIDADKIRIEDSYTEMMKNNPGLDMGRETIIDRHTGHVEQNAWMAIHSNRTISRWEGACENVTDKQAF